MQQLLHHPAHYYHVPCRLCSPRVCNSTNLCETLSCNEATNTCDIVSTTDCSRFSGPCTEGRCNPADGSCFAANIKEDQPCDDGRFCTTGTGELSGSRLRRRVDVLGWLVCNQLQTFRKTSHATMADSAPQAQVGHVG